VIAAVILASSS